MEKQVIIKQIEYPTYSQATPPAVPSLEELEKRITRCREMMRRKGYTHLVVYGDREHFANIMYLTHFDPRFEEALLILPTLGTPLLLVGNECVGHLNISPLYQQGKLRHERYQPFSLMNQPRDTSRPLGTVFREEGIDTTAQVGIVGWKYYFDVELDAPFQASDVPSYIVDALRKTASVEVLSNATDLFISPSYGLRSFLSPYEIAVFEYSNVMASEGMISLLKNFKAGVTDFEMIKAYQYTGYPLNCHVGIKSSGNQHYGLTSPVGSLINKGEPCSTNLGYWGSNICRAGWVAESENDLPESAKGYIDEFAAPYLLAVRQWLKTMQIGTPGSVFRQLISDLLPFDRFGVYLNPGHLIHMDEWTGSPIYEGSTETIQSGMYMQIDIIPRSTRFFSTRMEEGIVIADSELRRSLQQEYPEVYDRCMARRRFMESLGFELPEEILPLANTAGLVSPFFLNYRSVLCFNSI